MILITNNNHNNSSSTKVPSVFNQANTLLKANNKEFANIDKSGGDDSPALPIILGVIGVQSYLNAPDVAEEVKSGTTGSENILLPMVATKIVTGGDKHLVILY